MNRKFSFEVVASLILTALLVFGLISIVRAEQQGPTPVESEGEMRCRIQVFTGFGEALSIDSGAPDRGISMQFSDDSTMPFIGGSLGSRRAWEAHIDSVYLNLPHWNSEWLRKYNPKSFVIQIDSATGQLLKAYTVPSVPEEELPPLPDRASVQNILAPWVGLPVSPPAVTLMNALDVAAASCPLKAGQIIAHLVLIRQEDGTELPVWSIIGRGVPPSRMPAMSANEPSRPSFEYAWIVQTIVNAVTGEPLYSVTIPYSKK